MTKNYLITKEILDIYDKYHQDFELLSERGASKADNKIITDEIALIFGEYVDNLYLLNSKYPSSEMREKAVKRNKILERFFAIDVLKILRTRIPNHKG